jgi:hypothetical protein
VRLRKEVSMHRAHLPILLFASPAAQALLGRDVADVGVLALKAVLRNRKGIEVAHQQIKYRKHALAFSSRIGREGDLIVDLDVGVPGLDNRLVLETDLRRAERTLGEERRNERRRTRR